MKKLVIVPTLNERKNILNLYNKINKTNMNFDILFIDDNSIDGSQEIIKKLAKKSKKVKYIFRPKKMGIGSAHKDAFKWAYKNKFLYQLMQTEPITLYILNYLLIDLKIMTLLFQIDS